MLAIWRRCICEVLEVLLDFEIPDTFEFLEFFESKEPNEFLELLNSLRVVPRRYWDCPEESFPEFTNEA